jgi:hypothetical protein
MQWLVVQPYSTSNWLTPPTLLFLHRVDIPPAWWKLSCRNVCGFPKIMHGGLTAAIIDEAFGFTWLSLRANKQLSFRGPAFTAHLEVDYKQVHLGK